MQTNQIYVEPCLETLKKMPDNFLDYDYWRNQDEKDTLVNHYYTKMKKQK
jgi:hypothetical protein